MWESRKMLFGENAIRRPQAAVRKTMPHGPVMYITMKKAVARGPWLVKPCLMYLLCISPFIRGGPP